MLLVRDLQAEKKVVAQVRSHLASGGAVHMVGVGGFGMGGLVLHLQSRGIRVTGCDRVRNRITDWMVPKGIPVYVGHDPSHWLGMTWGVRSTAVNDSCLEVQAAHNAGLPLYYRGFVLAALLHDMRSIAVSGTHGKTTVSAMIAQMLDFAGWRPSFCIGGEVEALGGVAAVRDGEWMIAEADESDGTLALYEPDIGVITNVEFDHMEHFETPEKLEWCFEVFANNTRMALIYCSDDARAAAIGRQQTAAIAYGLGDHALVRGRVEKCTATQVTVKVLWPAGEVTNVTLPVGGMHNARNALAACAVAYAVGLDAACVSAALQRFVPVRRRFEVVVDREGVRIISDYGHHPTEIRAVMEMAELLPHERLMVIFQPHRYTRTRALGREFPAAFHGADEVVLLPVYPASEAPCVGGRSEDLLKWFAEAAIVPARLLASLEDAWNYLRTSARPGDVWLIIGAGDVEKIAWWARAEWGSSRQSDASA